MKVIDDDDDDDDDEIKIKIFIDKKLEFKNVNERKKTQTGEPARGARSALPVGCFTRCVFAFVFVLIYV